MIMLDRDFIGPVLPQDVDAMSGVWAVVRESGDDAELLDVGDSDDIGYSLGAHERAHCWLAHAGEDRYEFYVHLMPTSTPEERQALSAAIRDHLDPPCQELP